MVEIYIFCLDSDAKIPNPSYGFLFTPSGKLP